MSRINVKLYLTPPFLTIGVDGIPISLPRARTTGQFLTLRNGSVVSCREMIQGSVSNLPPKAEAWIVVQPGQEAGYWPQHGLTAGQTSFQTLAHFGGSETEDIGEEFGLLLTLTSQDAGDVFRLFQSKESIRGLRELPKGTRILDRVRVVRR